jgi:hypothetical protein
MVFDFIHPILCTIWDRLSLKTISLYCPFKSIFLCQMILKTKLDDIKKAVVVGGPIPQVFYNKY